MYVTKERRLLERRTAYNSTRKKKEEEGAPQSRIMCATYLSENENENENETGCQTSALWPLIAGSDSRLQPSRTQAQA